MSVAPGLDRRHENEQAWPAAHRNAAGLLRQRGITVTRIIEVKSHSVLYVGSGRCAMTAWLLTRGARLDIACEPGFPAFQTTAARIRQPLSRDAARDDLDAADQA